MLNFRFHIVSLVAVFLALAIGIIMGSTVIDRALVDTLEDQQQSLRTDLDDLSEENATLRRDLGDLQEAGDRLASEGGERLLSGTLADVPVLVVAVRGIDTAVLDGLGAQLDTSGAARQGTLWLTDRLALPDEASVADLTEVLGLEEGTPAEELRTEAAEEVAEAIRAAVIEPEDGTTGEPPPGDGASQPGPGGAETTTTLPDPTPSAPPGSPVGVLLALRESGFVEYDAPDGEADDVAGLAVPGSRVVLVSGATAAVPDAGLAVPLARALVAPDADGAPAVDLLAAEGQTPREEGEDDGDDREPQVGLVQLLRDDDAGDRLSTVDNLDAFAGRVAAVVAVQDLGAGRRGHYGVGPGAQRLVPAPAE